MTIIKVGDRFINMDNVTNIATDDQGNAKVEYADRSEWIFGYEARALRNWLNCISADVVKMYAQDIAESEVSQ